MEPTSFAIIFEASSLWRKEEGQQTVEGGSYDSWEPKRTGAGARRPRDGTEKGGVWRQAAGSCVIEAPRV